VEAGATASPPATPGGTTANLYSHLAHGDVALNITLTAVNSVLAVVTLPLIVNLALAHFMGDDQTIPLQFGKVLQVFAIVLVPVAVRNYAVGGGFYVTTSQFGSNFFIGNNPKSDGTYMSLRYGRGAPEYERQDATELAEHALGRTLTPSEVSRYWTDRAMGFISSQPGAWLRLVGRKFLLLWNAGEMLDTESQETYAEWSLPLRIGAWIGHFGILVPFAVFGMWAAWPDRRRLWVFYAMTLAYAASVVLFYVFARYRFPLVPFLMLFAAAGIARVWQFVGLRAGTEAPAAMPSREARHQRSTRWGWGPSAGEKMLTPTLVATLITATILTNWPILSKPLMRAITENNLAVAFQEEGRLDEAIAHYRRSISGPTTLQRTTTWARRFGRTARSMKRSPATSARSRFSRISPTRTTIWRTRSSTRTSPTKRRRTSVSR
jgi:hypothetical protein